jgi:hypothetical protein
MNREDIIRMAREQGLPETADEGIFIVSSDDLGRLMAAEREACAKVCADLWCQEPEPGDARDCYDAIRARGQS